jgi:NADPH-dependent 2,4-dienoyl-CoA reductase/sulfur reductase-like enzyme/rhodanese-related sulfurtransferase
LKPNIPGIDSPLLFTVRDIPDVDGIKGSMAAKSWKRVAVLGGGYIGLEMVEQLHRLGIEVTLIQSLPQVLGQVDGEIAAALHDTLNAHKVSLILNDPLLSVETHSDSSGVTLGTRSGKRIEADAAILALGVRPETTLAVQAGIELGPRGGIRVDRHLATSEPHVWAVGDVVEVNDYISGTPSLIALAGPANRQGRMVANNIFGANEAYPGTLGTAVIRVFNLTVACTGSSERALKARNTPYKAIHLHPNSHAGYYPGAHPISIKLLFDPNDGRILGAQAIGEDGVEKRIDVIATAIKGKLRAQDLAELELCYAPPYGSAKDPVNLAGMIAQNHLQGLVDSVTWDSIPADGFLLDVRDSAEVEKGRIPGSTHIPLNELRSLLSTLPKQQEIIAYCQSGQRSYYACRILTQHGFRCRNLSGAYKTWALGQ